MKGQHTVHDAAALIVNTLGRMPATKLHKLLYYAQAWSLVWDERPLFRDRIEAWANGPVVPSVYRLQRGQYSVGTWKHGDPTRLDQDARETIESVIEFYGPYSSAELISQTHREAPWKNARVGLLPGQYGKNVITHAAMAEYYSGLLP